MNSPQLFIFCSRIVPGSNFSLFSLLSGCEMTSLPFPLKGQTTGTIRASSSFLKKNPTTTLHLQPPSTITLLHPPPSTLYHHHHSHLNCHCQFPQLLTITIYTMIINNPNCSIYSISRLFVFPTRLSTSTFTTVINRCTLHTHPTHHRISTI
ncbi:hypothetical protein Hanom_Chr06g00560531 [Helianthus anomalus]